uniref:Isolate 10 chitinase mRNA n=1 Tax=Nilaparvata lugens TaxID=108931 RepID=A0A0C5CH54_NILLU|nr:chitinase [Nilaparvata lugens]
METGLVSILCAKSIIHSTLALLTFCMREALQQSGGVASNAEGQSEVSVSASSQSEVSAAPYVLSTPHDGSCRYGQHGFERTNTGHGYRKHKIETSRQYDYEQRQEVVDSYKQHKYEPVNGYQAYRQHDNEERQEVVDSYGEHDSEQTRREKAYRQHDNELEYSDCSHIFYRCDHLMMHRYLCPIGSAYEPALGKCSVKCPEQKLNEINNTTTLQKAELRKKPNHNAVGDKQEPSGPRVVCYFTNWAWYRKGDGKFLPEHIEPSLCTHIIYAFASLDPNDLTLKPFDSWSDIDNNLFARVVARAAGSGASVLLSMGGWTDSAGSKYSQLVADKSNRRRFVADCVQTLRRHSFDGLQLDWNYPVCWQSNCKKGPAADKANFAKFVQELRQAFDKEKPRLQLSIAISGYREIVDRAYDMRALSQQADFINVMSFDYHGAWEHETGHVAPLYPTAGEMFPDYNVAKYILTEKLGGAMAWTIDLDDFHNRCCKGHTFPLLRALNSGLGRIKGPVTSTQDCTKPTLPSTPPPVLTTLTPDNGLVSPEATSEMSSSSTTTTTQSWWTEEPSTSSTTTTKPTTSDTTTTKPITSKPTTSSTTTTTEEEPETTDEEEPEEETTTSTTTTTTTRRPTTKRPKPTRPKPTKPRPSSTTSKPSSKPTRPSKPKPPPLPPPTLPPSEEVGATELPSSCTSGEYRADPSDCNAYYRCILGEFRRQRCAGSLHWNSKLQVCDWPQQAKCQTKPGHIESSTSTSTTERLDEWWTQSSSTWWSPELTTPPHHITTTSTTSTPWWTPQSTTWWPTSSSTTTTHKPSSSTKRPATTKRPKPSRPSSKPTHRPTRPSTTTTEAPPPSPPEACTDGQYYPVREACDQYEVCVNVELEWSRKSAGCSKGQFTAHPSNCNQYLQCQWGAYQIYSCPPGLHWNAKNNICDWPSRSTCRVTSPSNPQGGSKPDNKPPSGSSKPVSLATTSTNRPEWEWKPDPTSTSNPQWEWKPETTPKPKPIPNKPSKPSGKHPLANGPFKVVCYFTNWAWYRTGPAKYLPEDIDTNLCTHVLYGFAVLDFENLIIKAHDSWADFDNKFYERVVAMKKKGVHVLLAIGGWNDSQGDKYSRLVNSAASRQRFIQHVVPFLLKYDFDGLDLDWEYPKCWQVNCDKGPASDKESFGLFVKELKTAFRSHDLLLSAAVSPSKAVIDEGYDVKTMAKYLDWISVMTYDYHGQWDKKTGHLAPMYYHPEDDFDYFNANYSINYWLSEGVPKHKLVMGMPLYGQSFTLAKREQHGLNAPAPGPGQAGESTRAAGFLAYYEICSRIKNGGWTVVQDEEQRMGPYAYNGDQWISFDDKDTIRRKSEWIREMGIGGGMIWALDLDDFRNTCGGGKHPLLTIIAKTLAKPGQGL